MTAQAVVKREPTNFEVSLQEYEPQIAAVLPAHIPAERFRRIVITAVNQNPSLLAADRRSLFTSCIKAAQDGLYPDGREAALVIFNTKIKINGREEWREMVQYLPMIFGIRKRMRNTGEVKSATAEVVYQNDTFDYALGDEPYIHHKPALGERGQPIAVYAIIKLTNGEIIREVMDVAAVEKVRNISRSKNGPAWTGWWGEMARKTCLRRASKAAPTSPEIDTMLHRDDEIEGHASEPIQLPPPRPTRASVHVVEPREEAEPVETASAEHDPETGEIEEGQEPAADIVLETADAMATEPKKEIDPNAIPDGTYTIKPALDANGNIDVKSCSAMIEACVAKAEMLDILTAIVRDNSGPKDYLAFLGDSKAGKAELGRLTAIINAKRSALMTPGENP